MVSALQEAPFDQRLELGQEVKGTPLLWWCKSKTLRPGQAGLQGW